MTVSLTGPPVASKALTTAPLPRPPQPISASRIVLSSAACTCGMATPAKAVPAAAVPPHFKKLAPRRAVRTGVQVLIRWFHDRFSRSCRVRQTTNSRDTAPRYARSVPSSLVPDRGNLKYGRCAGRRAYNAGAIMASGVCLPGLARRYSWVGDEKCVKAETLRRGGALTKRAARRVRSKEIRFKRWLRDGDAPGGRAVNGCELELHY